MHTMSEVKELSIVEHCNCNRRCIPTCFCCGSRWRSSILRLGFSSLTFGPNAKRSARNLDCSINCHMYYSPLCSGLHISDPGRWSTFCCSLWLDCIRAILPHPEEVSNSKMEFGEVEQTISIHCHLLEWLG